MKKITHNDSPSVNVLIHYAQIVDFHSQSILKAFPNARVLFDDRWTPRNKNRLIFGNPERWLNTLNHHFRFEKRILVVNVLQNVPNRQFEFEVDRQVYLFLLLDLKSKKNFKINIYITCSKPSSTCCRNSCSDVFSNSIFNRIFSCSLSKTNF